MKKILSQVYRFIEIDFQYFTTSMPVHVKISYVIKTNFVIFKNLIIKPSSFRPIQFGDTSIYYDTPYATKTFLAAVYDFYIETKLLTIFSREPVIIDIGANIGQFHFAIRSFLPEAKVFCYEPDPDIYKILKHNTSFFPYSKVYNRGLGEKNKRSTFYRSEQFSEWSTLTPIIGNTYKQISVDIKKGDSEFANLESIDLLKIDVEGAEFKVLKGLEKTLKKCKYALIEVSIARDKKDLGSSKLFMFMLKNNFHVDHIGRIFSAGVGKEQGAVDILFKNSQNNI